MPLVTLEHADTEGVRVLTLNDPDRRNALSPELKDALGAAVDEVAADRSVRVLVVTGAGGAFSAGADLPALFGELDPNTRVVRDGLHEVYESFLRVRRLPIPTIAAVDGAAVGAGVNLALSCDVRIAGPSAKFGVTFTKLGLHPGGGCTYFLTQALGRQRALALIMDGGVLNADEALALGLTLRTADDALAEALALADRWATVEPALARDIKRAVGIADRGSFEDTLEFEAWAQAAATQDNPLLEQAVARFRR